MGKLTGIKNPKRIVLKQGGGRNVYPGRGGGGGEQKGQPLATLQHCCDGMLIKYQCEGREVAM
jgi:hypothetical protein